MKHHHQSPKLPAFFVLSVLSPAMGIALGILGYGMTRALAQETPPANPGAPAEAEAEANPKTKSKPKPEAPAVEHATAVLVATDGSKVTGYVNFKKSGDKVRVTGRVENLSPGKHGFHIHQFGDLTSADGASAGGHFDPFGKPHGGQDQEKRHVGDLGNIEAGEDGIAKIDILDAGLKFEGEASILGRSVVVHAGEDDLESQPSGDAGDRVAVGVIGVTRAAKVPAKEGTPEATQPKKA